MKIPTNEKIAVTYIFEGIKEYIITRNTYNGKFMLYRIVDGDYQKLKTADTPVEFDKIVEKDRSK